LAVPPEDVILPNHQAVYLTEAVEKYF